MEKMKIFYDSIGETLNVWFDEPKKEYSSEEVDEDTVISFDKKGKVIGFEKLNYTWPKRARVKTLPLHNMKV